MPVPIAGRNLGLGISPFAGFGRSVTASAARLAAERAPFQKALLDWYRTHRRSLPWREQPSAYKTVVSEFMLQQTQVKTVLPFFARWMKALPDFAALAAAPPDRVLKLWEGLGYYSRARNLHRLAQALVALPAPPRTPEAWRELPGVGPYTSAAITSIAFGVPAACVDGNVVRILARLTADDTPFRDSASAAKAFTPLGEALVSHDHPGNHNQAMMELGATVCFRQNPLCTVCPVGQFCKARRLGDPEAYPKLAARKIEQRTVLRAWCRNGTCLLLHRVAAGAKQLAGLHELPELAAIGISPGAVIQTTPLATKKRGITRFAITELIYAIKSPPVVEGNGLVWVPLDDLESVTLSGPHKRWVRELLG